ncbi:hypothetical protein CMALT430_10090 [Carnobacterium maltaromaticum]|nr:hypothetical protein CMALT430_10090 [Carnobacterium maltaromaticum]
MDLTQLIFPSLNIICMFYPKLLRLAYMSQPANYLIWNYFITKLVIVLNKNRSDESIFAIVSLQNQL